MKMAPIAVLAPGGEEKQIVQRAAPPHLLRCLVVSLSAERRRLIRSAAETQAWDAIICRDAGEFLRAAFERSVPLMIVDLPREGSADYRELRDATEHARQMSKSLLLVSGYAGNGVEEVWARGLGAWGYLNEANSQRSYEFMLSEARLAIARMAPRPDPTFYAKVKDDGW